MIQSDAGQMSKDHVNPLGVHYFATNFHRYQDFHVLNRILVS